MQSNNEIVECWKYISGSDNAYISNLGRVKRNDKIMENIPKNKGFLVAAVGGSRSRIYVHKAVAMSFIDNPDNKKNVIHKDGNKTNNVVSNLEWIKRKTCHVSRPNNKDNERIGQKMKNKYGVIGEIIDVDRRKYENGSTQTWYVVKLHNGNDNIINVSWECFKTGKFGGSYTEGRYVGEEYKSKDGHIATIIEFHSSKDFCVKFEDGEIRHMTNFSNVKNGYFRKYIRSILCEDDIKNILNIHKLNSQGYGMMVKEFRKASDIDVIFDDGEITYGATLHNFNKGSIFHPRYKTLKLEKLNRILSVDNIQKVIKYQNRYDIDILLSNGETVNTTYGECVGGSFNTVGSHEKLTNELIAERKLIEKTKDGHKCHIQSFHKSYLVDIIFDDGKVVKNVKWTDFRDGNFDYPLNKDKIVNRLAKRIMDTYKAGAKRRNIEFSLTLDQFKNLIQQPCVYTGIPYSNTVKYDDIYLNYNGLDRIDSSKGYTIDNVVPCSRSANIAKSDKSLNEFYEFIIKTHTHLINNSDLYNEQYSNYCA